MTTSLEAFPQRHNYRFAVWILPALSEKSLDSNDFLPSRQSAGYDGFSVTTPNRTKGHFLFAEEPQGILFPLPVSQCMTHPGDRGDCAPAPASG